MFKSLLNREISLVFSSIYALIFGILFFVVNGLLLWIFPGNYNILDNGYATLERFFNLSALIFLFLIPALTMRSVSEEKQTKTLNLQYSRPISISALFFSKLLSNLVFILFLLICSSVYLVSIYKLGNPVGNIDIQVVILSYIGLLLIASVFIAWGIVASSFTKSSIVSFIIAIFFNALLFYGYDFISQLISNGRLNLFMQSLGLLDISRNLYKGLVYRYDLFIILNYIFLAWLIFILILRFRIKSVQRTALYIILSLSIINILNFILPDKKIDLTEDKRYTLSESTITFLNTINDKLLDSNIHANIYLSGDINYSFQRLANSTYDVLNNFNQYLQKSISITSINVENLKMSDTPSFMTSNEMPPIVLNEKSREGKITQQLIYPYLEIINNQDTIRTLLLKNVTGFTAEEKINLSIEELESNIIQNIRILTSKEEQHIAFIEGHDELDRAYIYDAEEMLSKYFFINRGQIGNEVGVLDNFKVVIIAGPKEKYTEQEKYILDQYIMHGGNVLWFIDGTYLSQEDLLNKGYSASMKNDVNLDDLLFNYGVRINSDLIQDTQCIDILLNNGKNSQAINLPWYYAPILLPSTDNIITKNNGGIKSQFVSSIDVINNKEKLKVNVLLTSSTKTHIVKVPEIIDFDFDKIEAENNYFNQSFVISAVSLEGKFSSAYLNRSIPDSLNISNDYIIKNNTNSKMIVVSSSSIIKNEIVGEGKNTKVLPLGFDQLTGRQYGNKEFIVNAVNWLAGNISFIDIATKKQNLRLLDKKNIVAKRGCYIYFNLLFPIVLICIIYVIVIIYRKMKYTK